MWQGYVRAKFGALAGRMAKGAALSPRDYFETLDRKEQLRTSFDAFFDDWDLWITPVAAIPAFTHRPTGADLEIEGISVPYALPLAPYNCPTAVLGHPILTLPAGRSADGMPIGLQVHARRGTDAALLAAERRLEATLGHGSSLAPLDEVTSSQSATSK